MKVRPGPKKFLRAYQTPQISALRAWPKNRIDVVTGNGLERLDHALQGPLDFSVIVGIARVQKPRLHQLFRYHDFVQENLKAFDLARYALPILSLFL
ncbi:MAG TPA: hypothetical protein VJQ06_02015 [Rhizomicrobium sp.]|nr:hypothetical protein [Rhizomicrobium sp.]